MKNTQIVFLLLAFTATIFAEIQIEDYAGLGYGEVPHQFGGLEFEKQTLEGMDSIVHWPAKGLFSEKKHYNDMLDVFDFHRKNPDFITKQKDVAIRECELSPHAEFLGFFPVYIGNLNENVTTLKFEAPCFKENTVSIKFAADGKSVDMTFTTAKPHNLTCADTYFFSTMINYHMKAYLLHGNHKTTFKVSAEEYQQIKKTGLFIFRTCDKLINIIPDIFKTTLLFIGEIMLMAGINPHDHSVPTPLDIKESIEFISKATGYQWKERPKDVLVEIDESLVNSGDFFAIRKFDGTGNLVEYGTGSHVNHCTVALRVDGKLYIAESNSDFEWPVEGLQMTPYKTWVKWALNQGYLVTWLPLKAEWAKKFDEKAAYKWFKSVEGLPYGIHNYIWGWLDTPDHNYPAILPPEFLATMFGFLEKSKPEPVQKMFVMGLNKRLGGNANFTSIAQVAMEAHKRGKTLPDLYAMVEKDGWLYPEGYSYVCSAFVAAILKAGGLFGNMDVNAVEFTPRDIYELEFYDPAPKVPQNCKVVDPINPYCQIMGGYRMEFPSISSAKIYANMNEHCWSEAPLYERVPLGC